MKTPQAQPQLRKYFEYLIFSGAGLAGMILALSVSTGLQHAAISQADGVSPPVENSSKGKSQGQSPANSKSNEEDDLARDNFVAEVQSYLEPFIYDPKGRRDPFVPFQESRDSEEGDFQGPLLPLQRFDVAELKLVGVIWNVNDPKAMFLDPNQQIHVVGKDERVGRSNGYIAVIREGEVVVVEASRRKGELVYSSVVVRIEQ